MERGIEFPVLNSLFFLSVCLLLRSHWNVLYINYYKKINVSTVLHISICVEHKKHIQFPFAPGINMCASAANQAFECVRVCVLWLLMLNCVNAFWTDSIGLDVILRGMARILPHCTVFASSQTPVLAFAPFFLHFLHFFFVVKRIHTANTSFTQAYFLSIKSKTRFIPSTCERNMFDFNKKNNQT